jgi:CHAT domain-containing protein/tetratricopeptide (TPR) repeat protein
MTFFGLCVLLFVVFSRHEPASIAIDSPAIQLAPGSTIRREIAAGAAEVFEITMEPGKLLRYSIDKGDLVLSTSVYGPTGVKLLEHISQELETVEISVPADVSGSYKIELRARETLTEQRPYGLKVEPFASVSATERKDSEARKLVAEAEVLRANFTALDLRQARDRFDQATAIWRSLTDYSHASVAKLKAGDVCFLLSEFAAAGQRYQGAAALAEKKADRLAQGIALSQLGLVNSYMGDNDSAQKHLNHALDLLKLEKDSTVLVRGAHGKALANMAEVTYSKGDFPKALDQFNEALQFLDQDRKSQARVYRFAGYITGGLGDAEGAPTKISRALELSRAINDKDGEGLALTLLGIFHTFESKQDLAIGFHQDAIKILRRVGDRHSEAIALNGLGQAYEDSNRSYALVNYEKALRLFENAGALDFVAVTTFKLGTMHVAENPELALKYLERCLTLSRAAKKVRNEANALSEIAIVYASQKRPGEAAKQHQKLLKFYETIGDHRGQAIALNNYGDFLLKLSQNQKALETYSQALPLSEKVNDKSILTTTLYNLARAYKALGNYEAGLLFIEQSLKIIEDLRTNVGSPELRALYFSGVRRHYDLCRDILMQLDRVRPGEGFAERAFLVSERSRARALLDLVQESQAKLRQGATAELLKDEREVGGFISSLTQYQWTLSLEGKKDSPEFAEVGSRLAELQAQYQEIQAKLRSQNSSQSPLVDFELKNKEQIQKELLNGDTMLLEYSLGDDQSYLWAITSDSFHSYVLPSRKNIEAVAVDLSDLIMARVKFDPAVNDYQAKVEAAESLYVEKARDLSRMLLGPVADQLRNRRLIFVTEGALQRVQFESLPVPLVQTTASQVFLIETIEIAAMPSMTTLLAMRAADKHPASPGKLVAIMADPVFSRNDDRVNSPEQSPAVVRASSLSSTEQPVLRDGPSRLVYASEEADSILAVAPRGTTMVAKGFDASRETAMSSRVGEYQIVHFATHGFFDSEHPELSGILLTNIDQNGVARDGLMALNDIYTLDLSAELTVLSACQTALGKDVKGEGLVGLTHSFMSAGSKSVVASLWKVDDHATAALMSDFYQFMFREGMPPVVALRAAKLKMMQNRRWQAPYYWAGFVFQGDYESRINVGSNSHLFFGVSLLFVVLISCGLVVFLRRRRHLSPLERN